jgi:6-phosphogluconolactonase
MLSKKDLAPFRKLIFNHTMKPFVRLPAVFSLLAGVLTASAKDSLVFFGTFTNELSKGIYVSRLDQRTGKLSAPELAATISSPNFLAPSPDGRFLYAATRVDEFSSVKGGAVSAFAVDAATGKLTLLNQKPSGGAGPCHVSVDASGKILFVANYSGGSVKSFLLKPDGRISEDGTFIQHTGHSVNPDRQTAAHAHWIAADPSDRFALTCDLGMDKVMIYKLNPTNATLIANNPPSASVPAGAGARHLAFSRDGRFAYVINELACTVTTFAWDAANGTLTARETNPILPSAATVQTNITAAGILVSPDGRFVYATVRGHDSVSVFAADARSGRLKFVENVPSHGKVPRALGIDPTGRWLIIVNQKSANAIVFSINAETGKLAPTGQELQIGEPVDVKFVNY